MRLNRGRMRQRIVISVILMFVWLDFVEMRMGRWLVRSRAPLNGELCSTGAS